MDSYFSLSRVKSVFDNRALYSFLLTSLFFGGILAFVYTFWGGPSVVGNEGYLIYDSMLFSVSALLSLPFAGLMYYFTKDVSLSLAPVVGAVFSLYSGFEDIMVYVFCTIRSTGDCSTVTGLPGTWPWLEGASFMGAVSKYAGFETVTDVSIVLSVVIGFVASLVFLKILNSFDPEGYPRL